MEFLISSMIFAAGLLSGICIGFAAFKAINRKLRISDRIGRPRFPRPY